MERDRSRIADRLHRYRHLAEVGIDAPVGESACWVESPSGMTRLPEGRVGHEQHHPARVSQGPVERREEWLKWVQVLDAEQEDRSVVTLLAKTGDRAQGPGIADKESPTASMPTARHLDKAWAGIDPRVSPTVRSQVGGENALSGANVEDLLAAFWTQKVENGRDRRGLVVSTAARTDPAVVPRGDRFPTASSGASTPRASGVAGHGRRGS